MASSQKHVRLIKRNRGVATLGIVFTTLLNVGFQMIGKITKITDYKFFITAPLFVFQWLFDEAQMRADSVGAPETPQQWNYIVSIIIQKLIYDLINLKFMHLLNS